MNSISSHLSRVAATARFTVVPNRTKYYHYRHCDPNNETERDGARKIWSIDLPDLDQMRKDQAKLSPDKLRSKTKEKGGAPLTPWQERNIYSPSTMGVIEPYKLVSDEQSSSLLTKLESPIASGTELLKTRRNLSAIKSFEGEDFDLKDFAKRAAEVYIKAHETLVEREDEKIFEYVTEHCYPVMTNGLKSSALVWKFLNHVEPPQVVQVRILDLITKGVKLAQITVKLHIKQIKAAHDLRDHVPIDNPRDIREKVDHIVFEKYLALERGSADTTGKPVADIQPAGGNQPSVKDDSQKPIKFTTSNAYLDYKATSHFYGGDSSDLPQSHNLVIALSGILGIFYLIFLRGEDDSDGGLFQPVHETLPELAIPLLQAAIVENRKFGQSTKKLEEKLAELMKQPEKHGLSKPKLVEN